MCIWDGSSETTPCRSDFFGQTDEPITLTGNQLVFDPLGPLTLTEPISWVPGVTSQSMWHHRGDGSVNLEMFADRTATGGLSNGCGISLTAGAGLVFQVTVRSCGEDMTGLGVLLDDGRLRDCLDQGGLAGRERAGHQELEHVLAIRACTVRHAVLLRDSPHPGSQGDELTNFSCS